MVAKQDYEFMKISENSTITHPNLLWRTNVVGVFLHSALATRLVGAVLLEIANERQFGRRSFSLEAMPRVIEPQPLLVAEPMPSHLVPVL
jgi:hypothetical protein